jgi:hypothetical protein
MEFLLLALQSPKTALRLQASPLKLGQGNNAIQVSLGQPLDLLDQARPAAPQGLPPSLPFLQEPMTAASPLNGMRNDLGVLQHLAQVPPDQLLQGLGRDIAGRAALARHE